MTNNIKSTAIEFITDIGYFSAEIFVIAALFFLIEKIRPAEQKTPFIKNDSKQELGLAALNASLFSPLSHFAIASLFALTLQKILPHQIFNTHIGALPILAQTLIACFIMDFSTYWRHRTTHTFGFLWPFHSIHHAATGLNWLTALRLHPIDALVAIIFDVIILQIIGFDAAGTATAILVMKLYNYFTHANIDLKFDKPVRYIFASPNFHRWHHATERTAYNKNFCGMFSLLDVMFGTYHHPETLPDGYGLETAEQKKHPTTLRGWLLSPFQK